MMKQSLLLSSIVVSSVAAEKCPNPLDVQDQKVKDSFDMKAFMGTYYEIAYHDYTQPIGICGCQRSRKGLNEDGSILDRGSLNCGNTKSNDQTHSHTYEQPLTFKLTENPGVWIGNWPEPIVEKIAFHDTLIDFGPINENGQYSWVLEFQCNELFDHTAFVGINFYSSVKEHTFYEDMLKSINDHKLHDYAFPKTGKQVTMVDHTGCLYNNTKWTSIEEE